MLVGHVKNFLSQPCTIIGRAQRPRRKQTIAVPYLQQATQLHQGAEVPAISENTAAAVLVPDIH